MSKVVLCASRVLPFLRSVQLQLQPRTLRSPPQPLLSAWLHFSDTADQKRTYEVVRLGVKHRPVVTEFLRKFFFHDEPLNIAIGMKPNMPACTLEEYATAPVEQGLTLAALAPDGSIVGLCINAGITREEDSESRADWLKQVDDLPEDVTALRDGDSKFSQIKRLLTRVAADCNVFEEVAGLEKVFDICILSVDDSWRGMGIAKRLLDQSREIAQEEGYGLIRCICTSRFSALAVARLGYRCIHRLDYEELLDRKGQRIFPTQPPHDAVTTYVLDL